MNSEFDFKYPSESFFERIAIQARMLPIVELQRAVELVEHSGSQLLIQTLSELIARLKVEVCADFKVHEAETDSVPYETSYLVTVEKTDHLQYLGVSTVLKSKQSDAGRILYGSNIFRSGDDQYVSERSYGN